MREYDLQTCKFCKLGEPICNLGNEGGLTLVISVGAGRLSLTFAQWKGGGGGAM